MEKLNTKIPVLNTDQQVCDLEYKPSGQQLFNLVSLALVFENFVVEVLISETYFLLILLNVSENNSQGKKLMKM